MGTEESRCLAIEMRSFFFASKHERNKRKSKLRKGTNFETSDGSHIQCNLANRSGSLISVFGNNLDGEVMRLCVQGWTHRRKFKVRQEPNFEPRNSFARQEVEPKEQDVRFNRKRWSTGFVLSSFLASKDGRNRRKFKVRQEPNFEPKNRFARQEVELKAQDVQSN